MPFTEAEKDAVTNGRIDFLSPVGVPFTVPSVATAYQTTHTLGQTWTEWVEQRVEAGEMQIQIWDPDRY